MPPDPLGRHVRLLGGLCLAMAALNAAYALGAFGGPPSTLSPYMAARLLVGAAVPAALGAFVLARRRWAYFGAGAVFGLLSVLQVVNVYVTAEKVGIAAPFTILYAIAGAIFVVAAREALLAIRASRPGL